MNLIFILFINFILFFLLSRTEYINPGFLTYRKSVAEGHQYAAIEWKDGLPGGSTVFDATGKEYIDCLGGFGIYNVGHSHPVVMDAVRTQLTKQPLHSQELLDPLRGYCAQILSMTMPLPSSGNEEDKLKYAFFTNSGTESVEACIKMAMLATGRRHFVGLIGAFHGKTLGSLSGTSKSVFRAPFGGGAVPFSHIPVNNCQALQQIFDSAKFTGNEIAGVLIEPILGEGGIHVCSTEFLQLARKLCTEHNSMLIFDEVQSGMGRTGRMWACEHANVTPDLMAIGKAFGGGIMPAGAAVGNYKAWHKYFENPFLHTTTFGGNPLSMAAAIATMKVLRSEHLIEKAESTGNILKSGLELLQSRYPSIIKQVRGRGLMLGLEFPDNDIGFTFSKGVFAKGILLSGTLVNARTIRVEPPLTITLEQVNTVLQTFNEVLEGMYTTVHSNNLHNDNITSTTGPTNNNVNGGNGTIEYIIPSKITDNTIGNTMTESSMLHTHPNPDPSSTQASRRPSLQSIESNDTDPDPVLHGEQKRSSKKKYTSTTTTSSNVIHDGVEQSPSGTSTSRHSPSHSDSDDTEDMTESHYGDDDDDDQEHE